MDIDQRNIYLEDIPLDEVFARLEATLKALDRWGALAAESVSLTEALGRVTAEPVWARISAPHYHAAAMDGYAVRAADTAGATETRPLTLAVGSAAFPVDTGQPMPPDMNAVIMIEDVQLEAGAIVIRASAAPWQHVRLVGEDMIATEMILPANHVLRPVDLGAAAGCGHHEVAVRRKPLAILLPTGDELVPAGQVPSPGQIIEYNSLVLSAQIAEVGGSARVFPISADQREVLGAALDAALAQKPDLILMLSGSSAGSRDFTASILRERGQLLVHGIAVRPGHPVIIGTVEQTLVIGVPGYPVSAALTGELLVQPLIARWLGRPSAFDERPRVRAVMTRKVVSPTGDDDFVRVTLAHVGERLLATPLSRGAGVITSLVRADGLAHIPRFSEGVDAGQEVEIVLYRTQAEIEGTLLAMGSHDPMLDLLGQYYAASAPGYRLASTNVGSLGGLVALRRRESHVAGIHLFDPESASYNIPYIARHLPDVEVQLITFAHREQGLLVANGNPLRITSLDDLPRVRYVNRQRGAGTRILLDFELGQRGINPDQIAGYDHEEYTHLAVAAAVASGIADCGLGVRNAALAMDLDFVPVTWERYDLVIPKAHLQDPKVRALVQVLTSNSFKAALGQQAGYDTSETGKLQWP